MEDRPREAGANLGAYQRNMKRVLCTLLTAGRPEMTARAIRCFHQQTYPEKRLYILDSGAEPLSNEALCFGHARGRLEPGKPLGELRNLAVAMSSPNALDCEIIAHWDSDDWSHPERLSEQVALLESTGAAAVGYNEMLFWDSAILPNATIRQAAAWVYTQANDRLVLGTSLCYWRKTWEKLPFPEIQTGEDTVWLHRIKAHGVSSLTEDLLTAADPRMIASIHGSNTCSQIMPGKAEWKRARDWDRHCAEVMQL